MGHGPRHLGGFRPPQQGVLARERGQPARARAQATREQTLANESLVLPCQHSSSVGSASWPYCSRGGLLPPPPVVSHLDSGRPQELGRAAIKPLARLLGGGLWRCAAQSRRKAHAAHCAWWRRRRRRPPGRGLWGCQQGWWSRGAMVDPAHSPGGSPIGMEQATCIVRRGPGGTRTFTRAMRWVSLGL